MGGSEDRLRLYQWYPVKGQEATGAKWSTRIIIKHKKKLYYLKCNKAQEKVVQRGATSPCLATFKTLLDIVLINLLVFTLLWRGWSPEVHYNRNHSVILWLLYSIFQLAKRNAKCNLKDSKGTFTSISKNNSSFLHEIVII